MADHDPSPSTPDHGDNPGRSEFDEWAANELLKPATAEFPNSGVIDLDELDASSPEHQAEMIKNALDGIEEATWGQSAADRAGNEVQDIINSANAATRNNPAASRDQREAVARDIENLKPGELFAAQAENKLIEAMASLDPGIVTTLSRNYVGNSDALRDGIVKFFERMGLPDPRAKLDKTTKSLIGKRDKRRPTVVQEYTYVDGKPAVIEAYRSWSTNENDYVYELRGGPAPSERKKSA